VPLKIPFMLLAAELLIVNPNPFPTILPENVIPLPVNVVAAFNAALAYD